MAAGSRVIKSVLLQPLTWAAMATLGGLEWAFFAWFQPTPIMSAVALATGALSALTWPVVFTRSEAFARALYRWPDELASQQEEKLRTLKGDFEEFGYAQGSSQLKMLREKIDNLAEVLKRRLHAGELTYGRYLGMAEQVYLSALDNLHEVAVALRSVSTIDRSYIDSRLDELRQAAGRSDEQARELSALEKRGSLFEEQQQRIASLMAQNESAMTVLDKTATALATTRTEKGHASMDAEAAMVELERLAKRVGKYAATR